MKTGTTRNLSEHLLILDILGAEVVACTFDHYNLTTLELY